MKTSFDLDLLLEGSESSQETISLQDLRRIRTILGPEFSGIDIVQLALVLLSNSLQDDDNISPPESYWSRMAEKVGQVEVNKLRGRDPISLRRLQSVFASMEFRLNKSNGPDCC